MADRRQAYHTPEQLSGTTIIRPIVVPVDLLPLIGGALNDLLDPNSWDAVGVSIEDTVKAIHDMIDLYYQPWLVGAIMAFIVPPASLPPGWYAFNTSLQNAATDYPELWAIVPESWKVGSMIALPDMGLRSFVGTPTFGPQLHARGGLQNVQLKVSELPPHSHTYQPPAVNPDVEGPGVPDIGATVLGPVASTGSTGGNSSHENMPPYHVVTWAIFAGR